MYLSHIAVRHQNASSAGMFINSRAAIGAWTQNGYNFQFFYHDGSDHNVGGDDYGEKYYDDDNPYLGLAISFHWVQNAVSLQNSEELLLHLTSKSKPFFVIIIPAQSVHRFRQKAHVWGSSWQSQWTPWSIMIMIIRMSWTEPVKIFLDVIEPSLLTLAAAPQTAESLTVFGVLHLNEMVLSTMMAMVMTRTKSFLCDARCVNGEV